MIMFRKYATRILSTLVTVVILGACNSSDAPLELSPDFQPEPGIDAAAVDPCASQFVFQREINGVPDETRVMNESVVGKSLIRQLYWYAAAKTIVTFTYAEGETWCNVSNESGVDWEF